MLAPAAGTILKIFAKLNVPLPSVVITSSIAPPIIFTLSMFPKLAKLATEIVLASIDEIVVLFALIVKLSMLDVIDV